MKKIRVLIIEDSRTVREHLIELLSADPEIEVVGDAGDGKTGIELCQKLRPDVVTLDMVLPVLSGLAATEYIMAYCPTPIVIVSASCNRGETFQTYEALAAGALDVVEKPRGEDPYDTTWEKNLLSAVKRISKIRVITHLRGRGGRELAGGRGFSAGPGGAPASKVVAIGASTGGPAAVRKILRALSPDFPVPILLVIHISSAFAGFLAEWLDDQSGLRVRAARDGEPLAEIGRGQVRIAVADRHLALRDNRLRLWSIPERHSCRPSVDVLFESVAEAAGPQAIACLLTGMGKDGAGGLLAVRRAGGRTIAQDQASSAVFGMPREAIALGAAETVLDLDDIAPALTRLAGRHTVNCI
jgi:two-component system, chemotaxis family, protein-glutamate methylesterase/glutaminase